MLQAREVSWSSMCLIMSACSCSNHRVSRSMYLHDPDLHLVGIHNLRNSPEIHRSGRSQHETTSSGSCPQACWLMSRTRSPALPAKSSAQGENRSLCLRMGTPGLRAGTRYQDHGDGAA